jgi:glycosyltransferase involved in cell wall biosynthesis
LRILHVVEAFGGGVLETIRAIANNHAAAGHDVTIAYGARAETPGELRSVVDDAVALVPLGWRRASPVSHVRAVPRLRGLVKERNPDVVHLHSSFAGVVGGVALRSRVPLVYTPHAFASRIASSPAIRLAYRTAEKITISSCNLVGAVSESEASDAAALGARDVVVVPNGIPELDASPAGGPPREPRAPVVVGLGRMVAQRQPEAHARILAAVRDVAEVLWIGGSPDPRDVSLMEQAGVEVTGWLPRAAALDRLRSASVYLHWTKWDAGVAWSVLEAAAFDVVVVALDIAPNRPLLDPRQLCATESAAIDVIRRVLADESFAAELVAVQRERRGDYSAARMVARWLEVYEGLAGG